MPWTRRWMVGLAVVAAMATSGVVTARWSGSSTGAARAKAQTVNIGNQPTATVSSSSVALSWATTVLAPSGQAVTGYIVRRYNSGGVAQTVGAGCSGTIAALACTENNVPSGAWQYSVTPALGNWRGVEGARRAVTVAVPTVTSLTPNFVFRNTTQTLIVTGANFVSGATVAFSGAGITINSTTFNSATQITVSITVAAGAATGTRNVTVTNPGTLGSGTCTNCLTIPTAPTVTGCRPTRAGRAPPVRTSRSPARSSSAGRQPPSAPA